MLLEYNVRQFERRLVKGCRLLHKKEDCLRLQPIYKIKNVGNHCTIPTQANPAGTFSVKIASTTYMVAFTSARQQKMKRLMLDDVKTANF